MKDAVAGLMICRIGGRSRLASCEKHMQFRKIDIVEVDDIISYHDVVTMAENWGAVAAATWLAISSEQFMMTIQAHARILSHGRN